MISIRTQFVSNILLPALVILTLVDLAATVYWVSSGLATEANPILEAVIQKSFLLFAVTKIGLAYFGIFILNRYRSRRLVFRLAAFAVCAYLAVTIWHVIGLLMVL